jgi:4-hydroxythreonine-4-phosphate dehydrogenase
MKATKKHRPRLAITMGDANGVGPEISVKSLWLLRDSEIADWILIGEENIFKAAADLQKLPLKFQSVDAGEVGNIPTGTWPVISTGHKLQRHPGRIETTSAEAAHQALEIATTLCMDGKADGIVTAPISKEAFHRIGVTYPGQTELLADGANVDKTVMCFIAGSLRIALATTHLPIKAVPGALSVESLGRTLNILHEFLTQVLKIADPVIGVCALNPHAGEGGILGTEEKEIIQPAVHRMLVRGVKISGPVPADVIFQRAESYDAILALYHDQGMIPLKRIAGMRAVNVTLGLPFVRTSPDHGTAFDIAWTGKVDPTSMVSAMTLAAELVTKSRE